MVYLLDANVLIDAHRDYYAIDRVPEFWDWLVQQGKDGHLRIPVEIFEEIKDGNDELALWIRREVVSDALLLDAEADVGLVSRCVIDGYGADLTDDEVLKLGRDPFLLAYALVAPDKHCIVTTEVSKPSKKRANRHLPDVARALGVDSCNTFTLTRRLDFRSGWQSK